MSEQRRFSKQRKLIYDMIVENPIHPSADVIYSRLRADHPELSLGTVYRNLNVLSEMGAIKKIDSRMKSERYDGRTDDHYHMICEKCGKMFDVETEYQTDLIHEAQRKTSHLLKEHNIIFYGICEKCCDKN